MPRVLLVCAFVFVGCVALPKKERCARSGDQYFHSIFDSAEKIYQKTKILCEPEFAVDENGFKTAYLEKRREQIQLLCSCPAAYIQGYHRRQYRDQFWGATIEGWQAICGESASLDEFNRGIRLGEDAFKAEKWYQSSRDEVLKRKAQAACGT